jgi:hypothetical protein
VKLEVGRSSLFQAEGMQTRTKLEKFHEHDFNQTLCRTNCVRSYRVQMKRVKQVKVIGNCERREFASPTGPCKISEPKDIERTRCHANIRESYYAYLALVLLCISTHVHLVKPLNRTSLYRLVLQVSSFDKSSVPCDSVAVTGRDVVSFRKSEKSQTSLP